MALREIELENRLEVFATDAGACASFAYTELTFRHEIRANRGLRACIGAHRIFWGQVRAALRSALFSTLGRLYDESRNSNSAGQLLRYCEHHLELFSRAAYVSRQIALGVPREVAAERALTVFEPGPDDLRPLFAELDAMRRVYHRTAQPAQVRSLRSARATPDQEDDVSNDELGGKDFAELVLFPLRLHRALEGLYREGRAPVLPELPLGIDEVLAGRGAGWEHVRAARSAAAFLRSESFASADLPVVEVSDYATDSPQVLAGAGPN